MCSGFSKLVSKFLEEFYQPATSSHGEEQGGGDESEMEGAATAEEEESEEEEESGEEENLEEDDDEEEQEEQGVGGVDADEEDLEIHNAAPANPAHTLHWASGSDKSNQDKEGSSSGDTGAFFLLSHLIINCIFFFICLPFCNPIIYNIIFIFL